MGNMNIHIENWAQKPHPGSSLLADSILRRENDPSLEQVFRQEKSLAVRMVYDFQHLYNILHYSELW